MAGLDTRGIWRMKAGSAYGWDGQTGFCYPRRARNAPRFNGRLQEPSSAESQKGLYQTPQPALPGSLHGPGLITTPGCLLPCNSIGLIRQEYPGAKYLPNSLTCPGVKP